MRIFLKRFFAFAFLALMTTQPSSAAAAGWQSKDNCDIPLPSIKEDKKTSLEECQKTCEGFSGCKGLVYVTGWQKCFLKASSEKRANIRFISGELNEGRVYEKGSFKVDHDHSGKDIERLVLADADECGQACAAKTECQSFTLIEGYRVCWLKKKGGRLNPKVFQCSFP